MGFRTVVLSNRAKAEYRLGYLVVRGEQEKQIFLSEIHTLIFESTAISLTAVLLCELIKRKIKVIFCDEQHNPHSELLPYYGCYHSPKRIKMQFEWSQQIKELVWQKIIRQKIYQQEKLLCNQGHIKQSEMLRGYREQVLPGDTSNREGHAAKVYFNAVFGDEFCRGRDDDINRRLNYGYAVLLSAFNRELAAAGFLTQLGIFHKNEFNDFNLSCDLMEPFRVIVDKIVLSIFQSPEYKTPLANLLNTKMKMGDMETTLDVCIKIYTRSVLDCLDSGEITLIKFADSYEL